MIQGVVQLYELGPLMVSHLASKFSGHRHCGNRDILALKCQVTTFIKIYMGGSLSR